MEGVRLSGRRGVTPDRSTSLNCSSLAARVYNTRQYPLPRGYFRYRMSIVVKVSFYLRCYVPTSTPFLNIMSVETRDRSRKLLYRFTEGVSLWFREGQITHWVSHWEVLSSNSSVRQWFPSIDGGEDRVPSDHDKPDVVGLKIWQSSVQCKACVCHDGPGLEDKPFNRKFNWKKDGTHLQSFKQTLA